MLRMFIHIFGSGKAVVLYSRFCVDKGITELESKCMYEANMVKKWCYWPKGVPVDLIYTHF